MEASESSRPDWDRLYETAAGQAGYVTTKQAAEAGYSTHLAGVPPPTLRLYPIGTHIAEKLHAYTMPRTRLNSRVKDLPDLALLASAQKLNAKQLRAALEQTFNFRDTHPVGCRKKRRVLGGLLVEAQ